MSSPRSLFGKTVSKKARIDNEDKQEHTTSQNTGRNIPSTSVKKPSFNPALLSSAFYTGPTMYGGAGACGSSSPYNQYAKSKFHDRKKTDIKVIPSTPETSMSQTSRRILDLLEQYSSPISDAKRVPINNRPFFNTQKKTLNTSSIFDISKKSVYDESLTPNSSKAHRFRELQIPSMATLMKIKKNNRTGGNVQAAIIASMSSSLPYKPDTYSLRSSADSNTYKNKIKTKVSSRSNKVDEDEMALPVNLPNISLNMTSLPTFTMEPFRTQGNATKAYTAHKKESNSFNSNLATNFKFTSPVAIAKTDLNVSKKFQFSEPLDIFSPDYISSPSRDEAEASGSMKGDSLFRIVAESKSNHSSDILTKPDFSSPLVNFKSGDSEQTPKSSNKRPAEQWNGNDNWKNKDSEKSPVLNGDLKSSDIFTKSAHTTSDTGKIKDSSYDDILNPNVKKIKSDSALPPSPISGLESFIKKQQEQWECTSCMTRNDHSKAKCVCCEASKPGVTQAAIAPAVPVKSIVNPCYTGMASFIKKQQDQWECSCCMTRNDPNRTKCVCCEAAKPGCEPAPAASVKFNFGNTQNTFKFGIDKANEPVKSVTTDEKTITESVKKAEILVPSGGFVFGNAATLTDTKPLNGPVGGFKFGNTNGNLPASSTSISNCAESKPSIPVFGEKKQEASPIVAPVGGFTFGFKKDENKIPVTTTAQPEVKTNLFTFSSPQNANESKTEPDKLKPVFVAQQNDSKAITPKPAGIPTSSPAVPTSSVSSVPAFSFGVPQTAAKMVFGNSAPFQFGAAASTVAPTSTADGTVKPPGLFSFSAKTTPVTSSVDAKPLADINSSPKPAFQLQSATTGSLFPSVPTQGTNNGKGPMSNISSGIQFNATSSADKPKDQASSPFFGFTPSTVSTSISSGTFKSPPSMFSFGSASTTKVDPAEPLFSSAGSAPPSGIFGVKPTEPILNSPSNSLFKPSPSTTGSTFQAPTSSIFGSAQSVNSQMPASNMFGAAELNTATSKPPVAIFGSSTLSTDPALQPPQASSLFSNPNMPAPSFNTGSIFGNTAQSGSIASQPGNLFGNPGNKPASDTSSGMFMSNPQPPPVSTNMFDAPTQSGSGIFGSSQAVPTPVFGASIPFGEASQNQPHQNVSFKFGASSSAQPAGVGFGQAPAAGSSAPVFSFGSGAPAPAPTNAQFNFSMGAPSSAFPSTPGALANPAQRRIKKAVRRNVLR